MKFVKTLFLTLLLLVSLPALADRGGYHGGYHEHGGGNGLNWLIPSMIIGGMMYEAARPMYMAPQPMYMAPQPVYVAPPTYIQIQPQYYCDAFRRYYNEVEFGTQCPYPGWRRVQ